MLAALMSFGGAQASKFVNVAIGAGGWRATNNPTIGDVWLAGLNNPMTGIVANGYYGNPATHTLSTHDMTWFCRGAPNKCNGSADTANNPLAYVARGVNLTSPRDWGNFQVIADDYVELWVNGNFIFDALLTDNMFLGQPVPLNLRIQDLDLLLLSGTPMYWGLDTMDVLTPGRNVFAFKAMDGFVSSTCSRPLVDIPGADGLPSGQTFCPTARGYRYLYVHAPEPATLAIFGVAALALMRRRKVR